MADINIKHYLDEEGLKRLVTNVKDEDKKVLDAAKAHAEGLGKNYDAAGSAATAKAEAIADADGKFATVNENLAKKADQTALEAEVTRATGKEAELQGAIDGVSAVAEQNKTDIAAINNETTGILAQAKADATEKANAVQANVDALAGKVGTVPDGSTVMDIINEINENAYNDKELRDLISGLADSKADKSALEELAGTHATDKEALEGAIALKADKSALDAIAEDYLDSEDKTELEGKINAKADQSALDAIAEDYLKAADKEELEGKINAKADQTALDAVSAVADAAATKVELKAEEDRAKGEEARIEGLVTAEAERAAGVEAGLEARIETMEVFWDTTEDADGVVNKLKEIQDYIASDESGAAAMAGNIQANTQAIAAMDEAYKAADAALQATVDELAATVEEKAVQADWNQNDETAPDYIKNRPFYDEVAEVAILEETTIDYSNGYATPHGSRKHFPSYYNKECNSLVDGQTYKVVVNGVEYTDVASYTEDANTIFIGNDACGSFSAEDNGCPFYIYNGNSSGSNTNGLTVGCAVPTDGEELGLVRTISIYAIESGSVKQLDEKYIPDTIARVADLTDATGRVDVLEGEMDAVEGRLDVVEPKVDELVEKMADVEGAVATKAEAQALTDAVAALEQADAGLDERIGALEDKFTGEGSVEDLIGTAKEEVLGELEKAIEGAMADAYDADAVVLSQAQKGIDAVQGNVDAHANNADIHVTVDDKAKWNTAEAKAHEHGNKAELDKIATGDVEKWNAAEQNAKDYAKEYADGLNTAMTGKVDGVDARVKTLEETIVDKADQEDLNGALERLTAVEEKASANESAIKSFSRISESDIDAMFAATTV